MDNMVLWAVAAVDLNWGLGCKGELLARVSPDLRRFKQLTLGRPLICGRRTLSTFPGGRPLPGRVNIVLSREADFAATGALHAASLAELPSLLAGCGQSGPAFVVGGASVYQQLLPFCARFYLTRLQRLFTADCFLPDLDGLPNWQLSRQEPVQTWQGLDFVFQEYVNSAPLPL